jgi:hypothetical protein
MKTVPCSYQGCGRQRAHHERPDEFRPHQKVEVSDDYIGAKFCSITCACMAGYYDVQRGWVRDPITGLKTDGDD